MSRVRTTLAAVGSAALVAVLAACGSTEPVATPEPAPTHTTDSAPSPAVAPAHLKPLRPGESRRTIQMPTAYTPSAPTGVGTDDYRCFVLDPHVTQDQMITGFDVLPGNPKVVHHVIMFRVPPDQVAAAEAKDKETPGEGWTCFGDSGLSRGPALDDAPWLGAWAPGGSEQVYGKGLGEPLPTGSRIVMQVHYNLLAGTSPDQSSAVLRLAPKTKAITPLTTVLMPAPVELPCRRGVTGPLCTRAAAVADVKQRFGQVGSTADLLHFLCGPIKPGPVQRCKRTIGVEETVRGVAGHMHLLGQSIRIVLNQGTPRARTLLDIPVWDFDNQASRPIPPVQLHPFDTVTVTCRHSQRFHDMVPAVKAQPEKYVVWGEGTTDEMCLGILLVTRP